MRIVKAITGVTLAVTCLTAYLIAKLYEAGNIEFGQALKIAVQNVIWFTLSFAVFIKTCKEGDCGEEGYMSDL